MTRTKTPLVQVDKAKCARDGICAHVCPLSIIDLDAENFPTSRPAKEIMCIRCGHCVSSCPHAALTIGELSPGNLDAVSPADNITVSQVRQFFRSRRSIRRYKDEPVPRETLEKALDIVRWAPSAKNVQPCHWLVINTQAEVRRMAQMAVDWFRVSNAFPGVPAMWDKGNDMVLRGAPCVVVAHAPAAVGSALVDCTIALAHLELAATAFGLGGCWAGFFITAVGSHAPLRAALNLPEGHKAYGAMMLGYPRYAYPRIPARAAARIDWR